MENELSIKISASAERALKALDKLIPKINQTDNCVSKMLMNFDKNGQLTGFTTELKKMDSELDRVTKKSKNLKNALNIGITFAGVSKIFRTGLSWVQNSIDYSEALNLFNVVLDESIDKGTKFQNVMNEAFGTNKTETLTRQGLYQSMAENMKIPQEYAYIMSETSTKLVNDIASLYNKDENTVAEAIRAGVFAGQTKPLRSFGMDITESSLQPILNELGLKNSDGTDRTVRQLSQAEKQILRYIAVLRQSSEAHGDWANTIEAPANQLKIFKNQAVEASRAFSNLFIGTFGNILPYANAILMVIKEVSNAIAVMMGIEITDYNTGIADMGDAFEDIEDNADSAGNAIKELKRQVLGFDQINNITENKDSGSGNSSLIGGIDQKLLDSIYSYDNGMESVRMKATKIRDQIMQWLGFTKEIDPLTGQVSFKLKEGWTNIKLISTAIKALITFIIAKKIIIGVATLVTLLTNAGTILASLTKGFLGLGVIIGGLTLPITTTAVAIGALVAGIALITTGLAMEFAKPAIKQFDELRKATKETRSKLEPLINKFNDLNMAIKNIDYSNAVMTDEQATQILTKIEDTFESVKQTIIEQKTQAIKEINGLSDELGLSDEEKNKLLEENDKYYNESLSQLDNYKSRYLEIVENAKNENRTLTSLELSEIYEIQKESQKLSIESLSSNKEEAQAIWEDMCKNAKAKSVEQASEIIKNSAEIRNKTIEDAKKQRDETLAQIESLKTDGSAESEALKQKMIENAKQTYEDTVSSAKKMHQDTYDEFKRQNEDIAKYIDSDTGKVKSKWSVFWGDVGNTFTGFFNTISSKWNSLWDKLSTKKAVKVELNEDSKGNTTLSSKAITTQRADGGIFSNGKWQNIAQYANGGLPPIGQMFIAREKGPEFVGSIGNKTAVMNNNQIVESVKAGVYEAVATAMSQVNFGSGQDIRVYAEEGIIVEKSVRGIQQYVDQTGELPFTVPV